MITSLNEFHKYLESTSTNVDLGIFIKNKSFSNQKSKIFLGIYA